MITVIEQNRIHEHNLLDHFDGYWEGWTARAENQALEACPYDPSPAWAGWRFGWKQLDTLYRQGSAVERKTK